MTFYMPNAPEKCQNIRCGNNPRFMIVTKCACNEVWFSCYICFSIMVTTAAERNDSHMDSDILMVRPIETPYDGD